MEAKQNKMCRKNFKKCNKIKKNFLNVPVATTIQNEAKNPNAFTIEMLDRSHLKVWFQEIFFPCQQRSSPCRGVAVKKRVLVIKNSSSPTRATHPIKQRTDLVNLI